MRDHRETEPSSSLQVFYHLYHSLPAFRRPHSPRPALHRFQASCPAFQRLYPCNLAFHHSQRSPIPITPKTCFTLSLSIIAVCQRVKLGYFAGSQPFRRIFQDVRDLRVPDDEGEVRVGTLVAHEPSAGREMGVEDGSHAIDFDVVTFASGREVLWVEEVEPSELKEMRLD